MIKIGSLFSGIGGFDLGLERGIPNSRTIWQVEQDPFCQRILKKHWSESQLYDDVCDVGAHNLKPVDLISAGFPCQDISVAGKGAGINEGKKSSLWWEVYRITSELRPRVLVLENVPAIIVRGLPDILAALSRIGYDSEWTIISARAQGACHLRRRLFIVCYSSNSAGSHCQKQSLHSISLETARRSEHRDRKGSGIHAGNYWKVNASPSAFCTVDDGIPDRVARLRALGNSIVHQCSEYIGRLIFESGLLDEV